MQVAKPTEARTLRAHRRQEAISLVLRCGSLRQASDSLHPFVTALTSGFGTSMFAIVFATASSRAARLSQPFSLLMSLLSLANDFWTELEQTPEKVSIFAFWTASARAPLVDTHPALNAIIGAATRPTMKPVMYGFAFSTLCP
jgi:hypothetical protein